MHKNSMDDMQIVDDIDMDSSSNATSIEYSGHTGYTYNDKKSSLEYYDKTLRII